MIQTQASEAVLLTTLTYGGEALGRLQDGRAVFVPFGLPGETVRLRLTEEKPRFARGELLEILDAAPERIAPRCIHFGYCGGCHYQHMTYAAQLAAKQAILKDQLERIGNLVDPPVRPAVPSPGEYYYRNHVQFALTPQGKLGYHTLRTGEPFAIQECHLPEEPLNVVWPQLEFEPLEEIERVGLRLGVSEDVMLVLESEAIQTPELSVEELDLSVVHLSPAGMLVLAGSSHLYIEVLKRLFRISAGSFFQVNTGQVEAMVQHVLDQVAPTPEMTVLDVYSGVGLFSAFLAPRVQRLVAIESSPQAAEDFVANLDEFENVELYEAPAEQVLLRLDLQPEVILVDPPRAGLAREALDGIVKLGPRRLVYVSCDPSTLARDARRLSEAGYRLEQATPFDLFPQTYHIESISSWQKE
jgi:23S rRNA (uracil1939-C5)-methyltransferase